MTGSPQEHQHKQLHPHQNNNYCHQHQSSNRQNNNRANEKKNNRKIHNKNRHRNRKHKDLCDGSVSTNSSGDGSSNSRNSNGQQGQNSMHFNSSRSSRRTNRNGRSNEDNKNKQFRNRIPSQKNSQENSAALNSYLRCRGWSLPNSLGPNKNHINQNGVSTANTILDASTATVLRESELVRKRALKLLETTLCRWAASVEKNPIAWQRVRVTLITFGSYRLRAYRPDTDVDLLALCPSSCTRMDFFTSLVKMMENEAAISEIHPIASAFTPVIKFTIFNIHFDMLFGRASGKANIEKLVHFQRHSYRPLALADSTIMRKTQALGIATHAELAQGKGSIGKDNASTFSNQIDGATADLLREFTIEDSFLTGMEDDSEVRSANGVRVTQYIMNYVPYPDNFQLVLCAVKEWAMLHGIYSNVLGFLGGVNWAIMVAFVCKRYPKELPSSLLRIFFQVFATWNWPEPVLLNNTNETTAEKTAGGMKPWDPKTNPRDARHVMPIITPVFPRMNSTYNIAIPQQRRIQEELVRAAFLTRDESNWRALYNRSDFFERHVNFLKITIRAGNNPGEFTKWLRLCESRLRLLVNALDCPEMSVWPFAQLMERKYKLTSTRAISNKEGTMSEALFFIALRFAPNVETIDLKHRTSEFLINQINSWEGRKQDMDFVIHHVLQKDLPHELIGEYVATKPSAYEIPNPTPFNATSLDKDNIPFSALTTNVTKSTKSKRTDTLPVPKDIRGPGGGDNQSLSRSTYSSIARSMNSSMRSVDGTETSLDGIEPESRPHSPLGNFITVEGGPPTPRGDDGVKKDQTMQGHINGVDESAKPYSRQSHLYEYLTGKIDDLLPVTSADESCSRSNAAESHSDQSSTRSPIKKRPRNNSCAGTEKFMPS